MHRLGVLAVLLALAFPPLAGAGSITARGSVTARPALNVLAGTDYELTFGWFAETRAQLDDFVANARVTVLVDGDPLDAGAPAYDATATIVWLPFTHAPLSVGTHTLRTRVEFTGPVFDGTDTYTEPLEYTRTIVVRSRGATTVSGAGRIWSSGGPTFGVDAARTWKGAVTGTIEFGWSGFLEGTADATCLATQGDAAVVVGRLVTPVLLDGAVWEYAGVYVTPTSGTAFVAFGPAVCPTLFGFGASFASPLVEGGFEIHAP